MSDLDNAINSINASAAKAENTATFLDDMSTLDDQASVTNPNNGKTVASIPKQVKDRTDELFAAAESDINQAVSDAEQSATDAQDAADSIGRYQGLWPDTGGSAYKGDTYQTQVSGTPTGQYFTALQNTTVDPIGDDVNWREVVSVDSFPQYTDIVYKASGGNSAVENMLAGVPIVADIGDYCKTGSTEWKRVNRSDPPVISDFIQLSVLDAKDFCPMNGVDDDLPGLVKINDYIKTLPEHTQTGTGNDCGGIKINFTGQLYVSNTWSVTRTRSLTLKDMVINPLSSFPRGGWLFHADNTIDSSAYAHEDLTLINPAFRGNWEANLCKLTDFLRTCLINPRFERYYQFGLAVADNFNTSHELSWFNASFFQRFYSDSYPSHLPVSCQPFVIDSPDNEFTTTVVGYCKDNIGSVTANGSATVFNGYHFYEGAFKLDGTHTFFRNGYWDGSHLNPSTTNWKVTESFIQATSNSFEFVRGLSILGYSSITGCTFRFVPASGQDNPSNYGAIFDASIHTVAADPAKFFGNLVKDNSFDRWNSFVIDRDTTQQHVIAPDDWVQLNGYWVAEVPFPRHLGNRATSYTMSEADYTKFCAIFDDGTMLRIRCYYVNGVGTVKPTGIVTVWADNKPIPNYQ